MLKLVLEGDDPAAGLDGQFLLVVGEVALAVLGVRDDTLDERGTLLDFLLQTHDHGVAVVTGHGAGSFRVNVVDFGRPSSASEHPLQPASFSEATHSPRGW